MKNISLKFTDKFIVLLILGCTGISSHAKWTAITVAPSESHITFYNVDWKTLKKEGENRKIWLLMNRKGENIPGAISGKIYYEFDCKQRRLRALQSNFFSKSYGEGNVVESLGKQEWSEFIPQTSMEDVADAVCKRK